MNYSLPGSPVHGVSQARILEWAATSFSMGSFWPRDETCISHTRRWVFTTESPGKPRVNNTVLHKWKVIRELILKFSSQETKWYVWWQMLTRLIVVINLQYNVMCQLHQKIFLNVKGEKKQVKKHRWCIPTRSLYCLYFCMPKILNLFKKLNTSRGPITVQLINLHWKTGSIPIQGTVSQKFKSFLHKIC